MQECKRISNSFEVNENLYGKKMTAATTLSVEICIEAVLFRDIFNNVGVKS